MYVMTSRELTQHPQYFSSLSVQPIFVARYRYAGRRYTGWRAQRTTPQREDLAGTPAGAGVHDEADWKVARGVPHASAHPRAPWL